MQVQPLLSARSISKSFAGTPALMGVDFDMHAGEIVGLVGANGAGKSTLVKIICGAYRQDAGTLAIEGSQVVFSNTVDARKAGVAVAHQQVANLPALTGSENLMLGREPLRGGLINRRALVRQAEEVAGRYGIIFDINRECGELELGQRKILDVVRALSSAPKILILDEPTATLSLAESSKLFEFLDALRGKDLAVLLISHHLREVFDHCDRVAVLKDGRKVFDDAIAGLDQPELVRLMVGRTLEETDWVSHARPGKIAMRLRDARVGKLTIRDLTVHAGEVVGIAGVLGAGQTELMERLGGVPVATTSFAEAVVNGLSRFPNSVDEAVQNGIYLVPDNRLRNSVFPGLSVEENLLTSVIRETSRFGFTQRALAATTARRVIETLRIKCSSALQDIVQLSGGNQQKVAFGRWVARMNWARPGRAALFLLDNPTEGVDVGSKAELYALIGEFTRNGGAVLIGSSEFSELEKLCNRVYVIRHGVLDGDLHHDDVSEERLLLEVS